MNISLEEYGKLSDRITELMLENERLRTIVLATQQWVSVKDSLPDDDRDVLAVSNGKVLIANYLDGESVMVANYLDGWVRYVEDECGDMEPTGIDVSYWMEMPEQPEVEDGNGE